MKKLLFLILVVISALSSGAQDPNFSQFFASPLTANPAFTGKFDGQYRVAGNYRNQWPTINNAFTTATLSFDAGILKNAIPEFDQFGVGIMAFSDKSGNGALQNNYIALSTAYHKSLDENGYNQLGLGFQGTFVNKRLDRNGLHFEDMLTSSGFTGVTTEDFSSQQMNVKYFDVNAGILFNGTTNGENNYYVGASMYHITRPKESFHDGNYYISPRVTFQAGGKIPAGQYNAIHLSANYSRQANATNTTIGGAYAINLNPEEPKPTNLYLGTWFRLGDAAIPYIGLEFGDFHLGATYDVNTSSLKPASNLRGGVEFSLIYIKSYDDPNHKRINCPIF